MLLKHAVLIYKPALHLGISKPTAPGSNAAQRLFQLAWCNPPRLIRNILQPNHAGHIFKIRWIPHFLPQRGEQRRGRRFPPPLWWYLLNAWLLQKEEHRSYWTHGIFFSLHIGVLLRQRDDFLFKHGGNSMCSDHYALTWGCRLSEKSDKIRPHGSDSAMVREISKETFIMLLYINTIGLFSKQQCKQF